LTPGRDRLAYALLLAALIPLGYVAIYRVRAGRPLPSRRERLG
jgi:hypothetical protein